MKSQICLTGLKRLVQASLGLWLCFAVPGERAIADSVSQLPSSDELLQYILKHVSTAGALGLDDGKIANPVAPVWAADLDIAVISNTPTHLSAAASSAVFLTDYYAQAGGLKIGMETVHPNVIVLDVPNPFDLIQSGRFADVYAPIYGGQDKVKAHFASIRMDSCYVEKVLNANGTIKFGLVFIDESVPDGRSSKCVADLAPDLFGVQNIVLEDTGQRFSNPRYMLLNSLMIGVVSRLYGESHDAGGLTTGRLQPVIKSMLESP